MAKLLTVPYVEMADDGYPPIPCPGKVGLLKPLGYVAEQTGSYLPLILLK